MKILGFCFLLISMNLGCSGKKEDSDKTPGSSRAASEKVNQAGGLTKGMSTGDATKNQMTGGPHEGAPASEKVKKKPEPVTKCLGHVCYITRVTPGVKKTIEAVKNFKNLRIVFNAGTGDQDLKTIALLPWVSSLELPDTNVTDFSPLTTLVDLKTLKIRNLLTKKPVNTLPLGKLAALKTLDLHYTKDKIGSLEFLKKLPQLEELILWDAQAGDLTLLKSLTACKKLTLHLTEVRDLDFLRPLENLEYLFLSKQEVSDFTPLSELKKLKVLNLVLLSGALKNSKLLGRLGGLENLVILHTPLPDLSFVARLKKLRVLKIPGTGISSIGFVRGLSDLLILDVSKNPVTSLAPVAPLKKLVQLHIKGTKITNLSPLNNLKKLTTLTLDKGYKKGDRSRLLKTNQALKIY